MNNRLHHPLWLHIPSVLALAAFTWVCASTPLPQRGPIHFALDGKADNWGSPLTVVVLVFALSVLFIGLAILICELWAREEQRKTFNPLSPIDDLVVGAMVAMGIEYLRLVADGGDTFPIPWLTVMVYAGTATIVAVVLEHLRPYRHFAHQLDRIDTHHIHDEVEHRVGNGQPLFYWESQNPRWMTVILVLTSVAMFAGSLASLPSDERWVSILLLVIGTLMLSLAGGIRTTVTRQEIAVRFGTPGFRVLHLKTSDVSDVELHEFSPLRDFGGYGIRQNREMKAYYLQGRKGVLLTTTEGKQHLLGSDSPDRLAAVVQAVTGVR